MHATVLIVSDEPTLRASLRQRLERDGHGIVEAQSGRPVLEGFRRGKDLAIVDASLPDMPALELLRSLAALDPHLPVIVLAAEPSTRLSALKAGAFHCAKTPVDLEELALITQRALEHRRVSQELYQWVDRERTVYSLSGIVGQSTAMQAVRSQAGAAANATSNVLISGETGTGKEYIARVIHAQSERAGGPFVVMSSAELAEDGALSENGDGKGSTSRVRTAHGGSLLLRGIDEASQSVQDKLWRFLTRANGEKQVDVRILATTRRDLTSLVRDGRFREDLATLLATHAIYVPPVRQRMEDVHEFVQHFVERYGRALNKRVTGLTPAARLRLNEHTWPGNVREIKNTVERAVLHGRGPLLDADDFQLLAPSTDSGHFELPAGGINLRAVEQDLVVQALRLSGGNQTRAAQLLGMNRDQIRYRIAKFHLDKGVRGPAHPSVHSSSPPHAN